MFSRYLCSGILNNYPNESATSRNFPITFICFFCCFFSCCLIVNVCVGVAFFFGAKQLGLPSLLRASNRQTQVSKVAKWMEFSGALCPRACGI